MEWWAEDHHHVGADGQFQWDLVWSGNHEKNRCLDFSNMARFHRLRDAIKLSTQEFRKLLTDASCKPLQAPTRFGAPGTAPSEHVYVILCLSPHVPLLYHLWTGPKLLLYMCSSFCMELRQSAVPLIELYACMLTAQWIVYLLLMRGGGGGGGERAWHQNWTAGTRGSGGLARYQPDHSPRLFRLYGSCSVLLVAQDLFL